MATLGSMVRRLVLPLATLGVAAVALAPGPAGARPGATAQAASTVRDASGCGPQRSGEQCGPGRGRRTTGGGEKVSHKGWPAVTGILWQVLDDAGHSRVGTELNDELLGHHGSDSISGRGGDDIIWGDSDPVGNGTSQRDVLRGGDGNDWIYPSHGVTTVLAGAGNDYIWAFYGRGTIDCGPGDDTVRIRLGGAFRVRNCEHVNHFCAFGNNGHGGCRKPGDPKARAARVFRPPSGRP
ncbi:MAG: hypothetical protein QOI62_1816 [Solirubrobacteraceae bacterium]|nr:hypothetical protein [Solirubrobacteraceae bacterium]